MGRGKKNRSRGKPLTSDELGFTEPNMGAAATTTAPEDYHNAAQNESAAEEIRGQFERARDFLIAEEVGARFEKEQAMSKDLQHKFDAAHRAAKAMQAQQAEKQNTNDIPILKEGASFFERKAYLREMTEKSLRTKEQSRITDFFKPVEKSPKIRPVADSQHHTAPTPK